MHWTKWLSTGVRGFHLFTGPKQRLTTIDAGLVFSISKLGPWLYQYQDTVAVYLPRSHTGHYADSCCLDAAIGASRLARGGPLCDWPAANAHMRAYLWPGWWGAGHMDLWRCGGRSKDSTVKRLSRLLFTWLQSKGGLSILLSHGQSQYYVWMGYCGMVS